MRRVLPVLVMLLFASPATAATIHGSAHGDLILGTRTPDRLFAGAGNDFVQAAFGGVDHVDCGPGTDVVTADGADVVSPNCEVVSRRLSVDPYANADSQHETAVEPDSFSFGSTVVAAFQLGRRAAGAAANIGTAVSTDAGRTWQRSFLPGTTVNATPPGENTAASDPSVAYDAAHGTWLVSTLTIAQGVTHVDVARSVDGKSWSAPIAAATGPSLDKEWIACDENAASPFRGRCYLEYTDDDQGFTASQFSTDGGLTWSPETRSGSFLIGTQPVVTPAGTLVVVAGDYRGDAALTGSLVELRSTDGGVTFTRSTVSDVQSASDQPLRAISLPSVDVDSSGTIYVAWGDCRFRISCTANDVVLSTSTDGVTWSAPARLAVAPASSGASFLLPGLAADPGHPGRLAVVYASFVAGSCHGGACLLGIDLAQSGDGGRTWTAQRLDAQHASTSWLPRAEGGRMAGDYFSTSYAGGRVVPVFALAIPPVAGRLREAVFAASLPALG